MRRILKSRLDDTRQEREKSTVITGRRRDDGKKGREELNGRLIVKLFAGLSSMLPTSSVHKTSVNCYSHKPGSVVLWGGMKSEQ